MTAEGAAAEAQRAALAAALLGVVGTALAVPTFWRISGTPLRIMEGVGLLTSGATLFVLRARKLPASVRVSKVLFLLVLVPAVVMVWMAEDARVARNEPWVPYEPNKLAPLVLAVIAPGWRTGIVGILLFAGSAVVHHFVVPPELRARIAAGEPFGVIVYGVFALVLLGIKLRGRALREQLEHARSEKLALGRLARVAMSLRDLANTPLQTLELVRSALLTNSPNLPTQADRMAHALERLRRLNDILRPYQEAVVREEKWPLTAGDR